MIEATSISKKIGKRIKKARVGRGMTQEQLAFEAGLNRAYIGYIERGERNPSTETLSRIAKALKVNLREIFDF